MKRILFFIACFISIHSISAMDNNQVDISSLDKIALFKWLYYNGYTIGEMSGWGCFVPQRPILPENTIKEIIERGYIDILYGKIMKIDLSGDSTNTRLYNRHHSYNGPKEAERIIEIVRKDYPPNKSTLKEHSNS